MYAAYSKVTFNGELGKNIMFQVPKIIRWQFKLETDQVLEIGITVLNIGTGLQFFYAKMQKDGRVRVPKLALSILQGNKPKIAEYILEVTLEPT